MVSPVGLAFPPSAASPSPRAAFPPGHEISLSDTPTPPAGPPEGQLPVMLEEEMRRSSLDYAMSVIVAPVLPDAHYAPKPVHRPNLYAMPDAGNPPHKP